MDQRSAGALPALIRPVRREELPALQEIECAAGQCFLEAGMPEIANDLPLPLDVLDSYRQTGFAWVAVGPGDEPSAYLIAEPVDGSLHVEQVSVHPTCARRGIGRALPEHCATHAVGRGLSALTLTTFAHVPWNAPYYRRCGFRVLGEHELTAGMRAIRQHEGKIGLDRWPRVVMRRELRPDGRTSGIRARRAD